MQRLQNPLLLAATALTLSACSAFGFCTEAGCVGGLLIDVLPAAGSELAPGSWELGVDGDGGFSATCAFEVSELAEDCGDEAPCVAAGACAELTWWSDADAGLQVSIRQSTTDAQLELTLTLDGSLVAQETVTPEYETVTPNGKGCDPICTGALVELRVP